MIRVTIFTFLLALVLSGATPARAVMPDEILSDPALEARARELSKGLRCVVCRNQSIDDSNAGIARDMRLLLRERLSAGDDDEAAVAYLVNRYGTYVLLKPPFRATTLILWIGPLILLIVTAYGFARVFRARQRNDELPEPLTDGEQVEIDRLLKELSPQ